MKITRKQIRRIIKEAYTSAPRWADWAEGFGLESGVEDEELVVYFNINDDVDGDILRGANELGMDNEDFDIVPSSGYGDWPRHGEGEMTIHTGAYV